MIEIRREKAAGPGSSSGHRGANFLQPQRRMLVAIVFDGSHGGLVIFRGVCARCLSAKRDPCFHVGFRGWRCELVTEHTVRTDDRLVIALAFQVDQVDSRSDWLPVKTHPTWFAAMTEEACLV